MAKLPLPFTFVESQTWAISLGQQAAELCWVSLNLVSVFYFMSLASLSSLFNMCRLSVTVVMVAFVLFMVPGRLEFFFTSKMHPLPILALERNVSLHFSKGAV